MKHVLLCLLYWNHIQLSASFPVEEKPGFTLWPLEKRDLTPVTELQYSGIRGIQLGISEKSHFGIPDPTCRGKLPGEGCLTMDHFAVDKMLDAREPKADNCPVPCLFYTEHLSGAAERSANFILRDVLLTGAAEGKREYQTIWDLHAPKYYPNFDNLDATPELKCAMLDSEKTDKDREFNGCQRLYFMSMSKAMASECSGEVFLMTMTDLREKIDVPKNGIWWQVEFPTLIDPNRPEDKRITKVTYLQLAERTPEQIAEMRALPEDEQSPPKVIARGEYWPIGHGQTQLDGPSAPAATPGVPQQKRSPSTNGSQEDSQQKREPSTIGFVKRAESSDAQVCVYGEDCYPYPYPLEDMYDWYKDIGW